MHLIYQLASYLVFGLLLPIWMMLPKLREGRWLRLGLHPPGPRPWPASRSPKGPRIWLHGASAGDVLALYPIIVELRQLLPDATLVVSAMTSSGHQMARDRLSAIVDGITFVPFDLPGATRRAVETIAPDVLVLEYTELWPNLIHAAKARGAKLALTNGRLSEGKVGRYRLLNAVFGNQLAKLDLLLMREEVEADRALVLGAPKERVHATGNTKFDNLAKISGETKAAELSALLGIRDEPIFVAGSTHEGEERDLLRCLKSLREVSPRVRMLIAPRYVERASKILALAKSEGLRVIERSAAATHASEAAAADVIVLDTMGELQSAYALATLVFVGGSFVPRGGQNILEPAGQGRPILFGPYMMNFRDSVEVLLGRGGIQVQSPAQLETVARELITRPDELARLGDMAKTAVARVRGASRRNAERIAKLAARR
ncbi:3-deoxy-D-manno-octulosonic acid transferase [Myxococcota bacterium]|nr:3-deoxy-D-manno-octulosonic acid transferase [Myxococcota bacterium]